jgi:hypothetical protein
MNEEFVKEVRGWKINRLKHSGLYRIVNRHGDTPDDVPDYPTATEAEAEINRRQDVFEAKFQDRLRAPQKLSDKIDGIATSRGDGWEGNG